MSIIYSTYPYRPFESFYWACTIRVRAFVVFVSIFSITDVLAVTQPLDYAPINVVRALVIAGKLLEVINMLLENVISASRVFLLFWLIITLQRSTVHPIM